MIVGIAGKKQRGKDTVCSMIRYLSLLPQTEDEILNSKLLDFESEIDYSKSRFKRKAFGDKLKEIVSLLYPREGLDLALEKWKQEIIPQPFTPKTYRKVLQDVGAMFRTYDLDFWVTQLFTEFSDGDDWIISDCRFYNEIDIFVNKSKGDYLLLKVIRDSDDTDNHQSEQDLDVSIYANNIIIDNNGTLEDLYETVKTIYINKILNK